MMDGSAINANIIYLQVVPRLEDKSFNKNIYFADI